MKFAYLMIFCILAVMFNVSDVCGLSFSHEQTRSGAHGRMEQMHYGLAGDAGITLAYAQKTSGTKSSKSSSKKKSAPKGKSDPSELGMDDPDRLLKMIVSVVLGVILSMFIR